MAKGQQANRPWVRWMVVAAVVCGIGVGWPSGLRAELIVAYATAGTSGSLPASEVHALVTADPLQRGAGVAASTGSTFNTRGWDTSSLDSAIAGNDYVEWGWVSSKSWDLEWMTLLYDRSTSGPRALAILLSIDDGMNWDTVFTDSSVADDSSDLATVSLGRYQGVDRARFRLYGWNASSGTGTFDFENFQGVPPRAIELSGDMAAVPEPALTSLIVALVTSGYVGLRTRFKPRTAE